MPEPPQNGGWQATTAVPPPKPHRHTVRVYYEDTDFSGVVYHASYLRFLERGRTELLRAHGIGQGAIFAGQAGAPFAFAVRSMALDFLKPARMDDLLTVETWVGEVGGASFAMGQRIRRDAELLLTAVLKVALVADGRPRRIPPEIATKLAGTA